jgi:hypothetical protein
VTDTERTLVVREASGTERVFALDDVLPEPVTVGRETTCTVQIDSPFVSRQHARIELRESEIVLVDLGSRNGSRLNGTRVEGSAPLADGDVIAIGDATIRCAFGRTVQAQTRTLVFQGGQEAQPAEPAAEATQDALRVDSQTYEVWVGETPLARRLSAQEFQLLSYLYQHSDRVCTRKELGDAIWGRDNWDPNMLHRLVHRLKEKLEPNPEKPRYVQTVPWVGYRLTP